MQLQNMEDFMTTILDCGYADLDMLDDVYSKLAQECCDIDGAINDLKENQMLNLNSLLQWVYIDIRDKICEKVREIIEDETLFNDFMADTGIEKINNFFIADCITEIKNSDVWVNCLDTNFNSSIDATIDFDETLLENAKDLLKYLIENED